MAQRRKRRTKAEIEAEKLAKAAQAAEEAEMIEKGFKKVRARDDHGHFLKDDPSTPENEAWEWKKIDSEPEDNAVVAEEKQETVILKESVREVSVKNVSSSVSAYSCRFKRKRAKKRGRL